MWCSALHVITIALPPCVVKYVVSPPPWYLRYAPGAGVVGEGTGGKHTHTYIDGTGTIYVIKIIVVVGGTFDNVPPADVPRK